MVAKGQTLQWNEKTNRSNTRDNWGSIAPLIPAPKRSGAKRTRALIMASLTLLARPSTRNPLVGSCRSNAWPKSSTLELSKSWHVEIQLGPHYSHSTLPSCLGRLRTV
eukprot:GHVR01135466.1.p2 GENE.GHVR01135466.1~~GHVR01135466.1.p2  ORF type:complete len:108 (+),score=1.81 GHVR01135466.1:349-672(+)